MDVGELQRRAAIEIVELGPEPVDPREIEVWVASRYGAAVLLAAVAEWDPLLLRRAALIAAGERADRDTAELLLDASNACG